MSIVSVIDQENNVASFEFFVGGVSVSNFVINPITSTVNASAIISDVSISFVEHVENVRKINLFNGLVEKTFNLNMTKPNRHRQEYIKRVNESEGNFRVITYNWQVLYDRPLNQITLKARTSNNFTYMGYKYFFHFQSEFINEIIESY